MAKNVTLELRASLRETVVLEADFISLPYSREWGEETSNLHVRDARAKPFR